MSVQPTMLASIIGAKESNMAKRRKGTLGGHATAKASKAGEREHDTRVAVTRGDTFTKILKDSAGFESDASAQEYLNYVAGKRDRFLQGRKELRDISPGLLRKHNGSPLNDQAKAHLDYTDDIGGQYAPILYRADRGFFQRVFVPAIKGKIWSRGNDGAEEEVSLHPFNTVDQLDGNAGNAIFLANIFSPFSDLANKSTDEIYLSTNSGVYEQLRVAEFQRALAGLKRRVLTHVNRASNDTPVAARADEASQITRDILMKSRNTYESTEGTPADKDRAVFAMIRREFGDMIPHDNPTPVSTGFDPHTTTAVRAFATLPARAQDGDGLYNLLKSKELRGPLDEPDLEYFRRALNIMESAIPVHRTDATVDLIDATAELRMPSRKIDKDVYADAEGSDTRRDIRAASKAGDAPRRADLSNFLATDEVPETLFGIPVVANPEQYTEADIAFFKEHPRAGGFYELGDEDADTQAIEGGGDTSEEPPRYYKVQPGDNLSKIARATGVSSADIAKYSKLADPNKIRVGQVLLLTEPYPGKWNNPGNIQWSNEVAYEGETGRVKSNISSGYFLTFDTPQNGLNAKAQVIGQNIRVKIPKQYREGKIPSDKFTVENLITVYAPPKDKNDTPGYIKFVADKLGVDKDAVLDIDDAKQMASLLRAIATRDSKPEYAEWFRDSEYAEAVKKIKIPAKNREKSGEKGK